MTIFNSIGSIYPSGMEKVFGHEANMLLKLSNAILVIDKLNYQILACNTEFLRILGYTQKIQVDGKFIHELSPEYQDLEKESAALSIVMFEKVKENISNTFYWIFNTIDHHQKFCKLTFSIVDENNAIVCIVDDLSELRATEDRLKKSSALLLSTLNNSSDCIWSIDLNYRLIDSNKTAKLIYKLLFNIDLVTGLNVLEVISPEAKNLWIDRFQRGLSGSIFTETDEFPTSEGTLYLQTTFSSIVVDGQATGVSCYSKNISQEKINEAAIRSSNERLQIYKELSQYMATNLHDFFDYLIVTTVKNTLSETGLLFVFNANNGMFTLYHKSIKTEKDSDHAETNKIFPQASLGFMGDVANLRRPLVFNHTSDIYVSGMNKTLQQLVGKINKAVTIPLFENGKLVAIYSILNKTDDYTSQDLSNLTSILDSAWQIARSIEYKYDLFLAKEKADNLNLELQNEMVIRKKIEAELNDAKNKSESSNLAKSSFLANMSHEIRTPMNAIIGFTEILDEKVKDAELKSYIESIIHSSKSLLTLINDVLDLSKVEAGKLELKNNFIDIAALFQEIESIFSLRIKEKNLAFKLDIQNNFPASFYLDEIRLRQILINLVGNAVKFTNTGTITLKACFTEAASSIISSENAPTVDLYIEVIDTGIGIDSDFQSQLFNSFSQQDPSKYTGTGLGLAICKKLIELMNGTIQVNSAEGVGTTFLVSLKNTPTANEKQTETIEIKLNPDLIKFRQSKILLVEDNVDNQKYFLSALHKENIEIQLANNGKEALLLIKKFRPDIIITDLKMPVMDGFQLVGQLKSNPLYKDIPVIASTAAFMQKEKEMIRSYQFDGVLIKPFNLTDLYLILSSILKYDILESKSEPQNTQTGSTVTQKIKNPAELNLKLSNSILKKWGEFQEHQPISKIKIFASEIHELGEEHNCQLLVEYGTKLLNAANIFDVAGILKNINNFPTLINAIKQLDG